MTRYQVQVVGTFERVIRFDMDTVVTVEAASLAAAQAKARRLARDRPTECWSPLTMRRIVSTKLKKVRANHTQSIKTKE